MVRASDSDERPCAAVGTIATASELLAALSDQLAEAIKEAVPVGPSMGRAEVLGDGR